MNSIEAKKKLNLILERNNTTIFDNNKCILVSGKWGIGKTYFIQNYFSEINNKIDFIYISAFGKSSIKDIEISALIKSLPIIKHCKLNIFNPIVKIFSKKVCGVNIDNFIKYFSIESINFNYKNKKSFICFDDIERKADSIEMKDLLGLIERAKTNFNVILIVNLDELKDSDRVIFHKYKEKVVDNFIDISSLDENILKSFLKNVDIKNKEQLIKIYLNDNLFNEVQYNKNNLRIFMKYIELILKLKEYLDLDYVDDYMAEICKQVIFEYFFEENNAEKNKKGSFRNPVYNAVKRFFINENINKKDFEEYFNNNSEVNKDLFKLHCIYRMNLVQFENLMNKIYKKINEKDLNYFSNQNNVISLVDILYNLKKYDENILKKLFEICIELYSPEDYKSHKKIDFNRWNKADISCNLEKCNKNVRNFIDKVNEKCKEKFYDFIEKKYIESKKHKNYEELITIGKYREIKLFDDFIEIFDYYLNELDKYYSNNTLEKISNLISITDSEIIRYFFSERIKQESNITKIEKYKEFDFFLETKLHYENKCEVFKNNSYYEDIGEFKIDNEFNSN